jgi:hypothetical protein
MFRESVKRISESEKETKKRWRQNPYVTRKGFDISGELRRFIQCNFNLFL